ncbi:MAG: hypothetical protein KME40_06930 [Komarekiella atlantica HA4396-MV6]|jgi:hypothetical protein|nr:hypothetical protein [Komarekiella atlantica HA4396-MV6]
MKKLILIMPLIICFFWIASCRNSQTDTVKETQTNQVEKSQTETIQNSTGTQNQTATTQKTASEQPKIGTVKELVNGDLMCYVTLIDENGTEHNVGASFEICAEQATFVNKKVRAFYELESVNDCQSAEPCGKSRKEYLITKMEILKPN